ncbi:unnamed protein product [Candida verbasci]|uniref:AB hydrolase-1 domain-containing protein n=1 Tax=Candida verbasci TaxID=1227364 RepID=A0A9W4XDI5_9ASCO|nr:unnamed protein product [Candida verbasci]
MSHIIQLKTEDNKTYTTISNLPENEVFNQHWDRALIILHGFPDINTTFNKCWPYLKFPNERLLLLAPKLRGYEPSSVSSESEYILSNIANDVKQWILQINPENSKPIHFLGHDWGALISFKSANLFPELITSMVTLAIPYLANLHVWDLLWFAPEQLYLSSYFLTMQLAVFYKDKLTKDLNYLSYIWKYWSPSYKFSSEEIEEIRKSFNEPGVVDGATAYYRHIVNPFSLIKSRWNVDFNKVPTLILMGEEDGCFSKRITELEQQKLNGNSNVEVKLVQNCGHFLHREQPEIVSKLTMDFIESHQS